MAHCAQCAGTRTLRPGRPPAPRQQWRWLRQPRLRRARPQGAASCSAGWLATPPRQRAAGSRLRLPAARQQRLGLLGGRATAPRRGVAPWHARAATPWARQPQRATAKRRQRHAARTAAPAWSAPTCSAPSPLRHAFALPSSARVNEVAKGRAAVMMTRHGPARTTSRVPLRCCCSRNSTGADCHRRAPAQGRTRSMPRFKAYIRDGRRKLADLEVEVGSALARTLRTSPLPPAAARRAR